MNIDILHVLVLEFWELGRFWAETWSNFGFQSMLAKEKTQRDQQSLFRAGLPLFDHNPTLSAFLLSESNWSLLAQNMANMWFTWPYKPRGTCDFVNHNNGQ